MWGSECQPELDGGVDQQRLCRDDLRATGHAAKRVTGVAVVPLHGHGLRLADARPRRRQPRGARVPMLGGQETVSQVLDRLIAPAEGCRITTACPPGHRASCATIHRGDAPELVWFFGRQCHIASHAIAWPSPGTSGAARRAASAVLQRDVSARAPPQPVPSLPPEALARRSRVSARAFVMTSASCTRASPSTKCRPPCAQRERGCPRAMPCCTALNDRHCFPLVLCAPPSQAARFILHMHLYVNTLRSTRLT